MSLFLIYFFTNMTGLWKNNFSICNWSLKLTMIRGSVMESVGWLGIRRSQALESAWTLPLSSPVTSCRSLSVVLHETTTTKITLVSTWMCAIITVVVCFQWTRETWPVIIPHPPHFPTLVHKGGLMFSESSVVWKSLSVFLLALPFTTTPSLSPPSAHCPLPPLWHSHLWPFPLSLPSPHPNTCCWTWSSPIWCSFALNIPCSSYLHVCLTSLSQILSSLRTVMRFYLSLSPLPCFLACTSKGGAHLQI